MLRANTTVRRPIAPTSDVPRQIHQANANRIKKRKGDKKRKDDSVVYEYNSLSSGRVITATRIRDTYAESEKKRRAASDAQLNADWERRNEGRATADFVNPPYQYDHHDPPRYPSPGANSGDEGDDERTEGDDIDDLMTGNKDPQILSRVGQSFERRMARDSAIERVLYTLGNIYARNSMQDCMCPANVCVPVDVYCIDLLSSRKRRFTRCRCEHWTGRLIAKGFFPTEPDSRTAISLNVLELHQSLSTNGSFSKLGFAKGLQEFHRSTLRHEVSTRYDYHFNNCIPFWLRTRLQRDEINNTALNKFIKRQIEPNEQENEWNLRLSGKPIRLSTFSPVNQCPSCFYRISDTDSSPAIISIDGNFQQNRLKHVGTTNFASYFLPMFVQVPVHSRETVDTSIPDNQSSLCSHNFRASSKPQTLKCFDETGLLLVVCRHDIPLRFLNIYAGERLGWISFTVKKLIEILETDVDKKIEVKLLYDIACQFAPYIKKRDPNLYKRIKLAVNKFHGYAHEFRCHERWGAQQLEGLGESDGEGTERIWSLLRVLVSSGQSTSANRELFIQNLTLAISFRKRTKMGTTLLARFEKTKEKLDKLQTNLDKLLKLTVKTGNNEDIAITPELLLDQHKLQRDYFSIPRPRANAPHLNIYKELALEKINVDKVEAAHRENALILDSGTVGQAKRERNLREAGYFQLQERIDKNNALLEDAGFDRDDWQYGGERWQLAARLSHPDRNVYKQLAIERKADEDHKINIAMTAAANTTNNRRKSDASAKRLAQAIQKTDKIFLERGEGGSRGDQNWNIDTGDLWNRYDNLDKISKLETLYSDIIFHSASRSMEYGQMRSRVSGTKEYKRVMNAIIGRNKPIEKGIAAFNLIAATMPAGFCPDPLSASDFIAADVEQFEEKRVSQNALFGLHILRSALLGTPQGPDALWAGSIQVRAGIDLQQRAKRCQEELEYLEKEWKRIVLHTRGILVAFNSFLLNPLEEERQFMDAVAQLLWERLPGAKNLVMAAAKFQDVQFSALDLEEIHDNCLRTLRTVSPNRKRLFGSLPTSSSTGAVNSQTNQAESLPTPPDTPNSQSAYTGDDEDWADIEEEHEPSSTDEESKEQESISFFSEAAGMMVKDLTFQETLELRTVAVESCHDSDSD